MRRPNRGKALAVAATFTAVLAGAVAPALAEDFAYKRVSVGQINGNGAFAATFGRVSADGRRVFFTTTEPLVSADTDASTDVYERSNGATTLVSVGQINGNGAFGAVPSAVSADGTRVWLFTSEKLVSADTDAQPDIYERSAGVTKRVSGGQINGNGNFNVGFLGASADGAHVFFMTDEPLVSGDTDTSTDIYDRTAGQTKRVSAGQINGNGANNAAFRGASTDGSRVFFTTVEPLVSGDTDTVDDVYERSGTTTTLVSAGQVNGNGPNGVTFAGATPDGSRVFFTTAEPLVSTDSDTSVDIYERSGGVTTLVSAGAVGGNGAFAATFGGASTDGTKVFFTTAEQLVFNDTDGGLVDVYQRAGDVTSMVAGPSPNNPSNASFLGSSSDGTHVYFQTAEQLTNSDTDLQTDIYERAAPLTILVSDGAGGSPSVPTFKGASADGTRVFFTTVDPLRSADTDTASDIYMRAGTAVSLVTEGSANVDSSFARILADGTRVFFTTSEKLLASDTDSVQDVYSALLDP